MEACGSMDEQTMIYLAAPYSNADDKDARMNHFVKFAGDYMMLHPGTHMISPLLHHWTLKQVPNMGTDYNYWKDFSRDLLSRCDILMVLTYPGWGSSSGVLDEIECAKESFKEIRFVDPFKDLS